jgi:hypothetical protein
MSLHPRIPAASHDAEPSTDDRRMKAQSGVAAIKATFGFPRSRVMPKTIVPPTGSRPARASV